MKQKTKWYIIGDPKIREKIRFWFKCTVIAFACIGVGSVIGAVLRLTGVLG